MPTAILDGISTRYDTIGSGPALLMYAPGGFDATADKWRTQGVYAKIKLLEHRSPPRKKIASEGRSWSTYLH